MRRKKEFEELCNNADDIYQVLYYADVSKGSEELMNALEKVDIWGYKDEEDFPVLLNLYTIVMKRENMLEDREQMEIIEHIKKSDTPYGYSHNGAYDFMTSVYYSNIIYILNGGEDIGFR